MGEKNLLKSKQKELLDCVDTYLIELDNYINRTPSDFQNENKFIQHLYVKRQFILNLLKDNLILEKQLEE